MIDLYSREMKINPYPIYQWMRDHKPVCKVKVGDDHVWALTRYGDVQYALNNEAIFTAEKRAELFQQDWLAPDCRRDLLLLNKDLEETGLYRPTLKKPMLTTAVEKLKPLMHSEAKKLADTLGKQKSIEFINDFAYPYIGKILGNIIGIEVFENLDEVRQYIQKVEILNPENDQTKQEISTALRKQYSQFNKMIKSRRSCPIGDVASELSQLKINGSKLDDNAISNALDLLLRSGFVTSVHMLGNAMYQLARRPDLKQALVDYPDLIPAFVDETLRLYSAATATIRHTTTAVKLHGTIIDKDEQVILLVAASNRDPRRFENPDDYDLSRKFNQHQAFGSGNHACLGLNLARTEIEVALECLLPSIKYLSCPDDEQLTWVESHVAYGFKELPLHFCPPPSA